MTIGTATTLSGTAGIHSSTARRRGNYFYVVLTQWQGEQDTLNPCTLEEAIDLFERTLSEHAVPYAEAFPGVTVAEA